MEHGAWSMDDHGAWTMGIGACCETSARSFKSQSTLAYLTFHSLRPLVNSTHHHSLTSSHAHSLDAAMRALSYPLKATLSREQLGCATPGTLAARLPANSCSLAAASQKACRSAAEVPLNPRRSQYARCSTPSHSSRQAPGGILDRDTKAAV